MRYPKKCTFCGDGMHEGYVGNDGDFCSRSCKETYRDLVGRDELTTQDYDNPSIDHVVVYDNGGETLDRYTVFIGSDVYGMSESGGGFNMYIGDDNEIVMGDHLGVKLESVPESIKYAVIGRVIDAIELEDDEDYWTMWDESFFDDGFYVQFHFEHDGVKHKASFEVEGGEVDYWTSFESNGVVFDAHYYEDGNAVYIYLPSDLSTEIFIQKINEDAE